jgi:hypothetical protein
MGQMSDTPETDAQELVHSVSGAKLHCVDVEFARKLERERDEARDTVLRLRKQRAIARNFGEQMERERNHWKSESIEQAKLLAMSADREERLRAKEASK